MKNFRSVDIDVHGVGNGDVCLEGGGEEEMEVSNNAVNNNLEHVRYLCLS